MKTVDVVVVATPARAKCVAATTSSVAQRPELAPSPTPATVDHLDLLESYAIFVLREVAAELDRPVILFSGGKDSAVLLHLAVKAFWPARLRFPVLHIDTGQNFEEVLEFRDKRVAEIDRVNRRQRSRLDQPRMGI